MNEPVPRCGYCQSDSHGGADCPVADEILDDEKDDECDDDTA